MHTAEIEIAGRKVWALRQGMAGEVGYVARPGRQAGYVIAVLTNGWSSWERGVRVVDEISSWVADSLAVP